MELKLLIQKKIRDITNNGIFKIPYNEQVGYLEKLGTPKNIIERSYFQFKCQMKIFPIYYRVTVNLFSLLPIIYYLLKFKQSDANLNKIDTAFITSSVSKDILPNKLKFESKDIIECYSNGPSSLSREDKFFLISKVIGKYWYSPYFCLKIILKIARYSNIISSHGVSRIITYLEFSFASSVLTEYCRSRGVEHINVMHGEKIFNIRDSFVEFDKFYVWDDYYKQMFLDLKASSNQFIIDLPSSLTEIKLNNTESMNRITYYLANETSEEMLEIKKALDILIRKGYNLSVRYHPRYADIEVINGIFTDYDIENPLEVSLKDSFNNCDYVASLYSTVLFQAYTLEKKIVIDDLSKPAKYKQLENYRYIMLKKPHLKLSMLTKNT